MKLRIRYIIPAIVSVGLGAFLAVHFWPHASDAPATPVTAAPAADEHILQLPPEKVAACGIEISTTEVCRLNTSSTVPGRLQYDDNRHIEVRSAIAGVIRRIEVKPGDTVAAGTLLAVLSSPEVGNVRADVLDQMALLKIAMQRRDWDFEIYEGLQRLCDAVLRRADPESIRAEFSDVRLGAARADVLAAYSRAVLAEQMAESVEQTSASSALPARTIQERLSERDAAVATLDAVLEQSLFDAQLTYQQAESKVEDAQRRLNITQQHLQTLLGGSNSMVDVTSQLSQDDLSQVEIVAPFHGTIEERFFSEAERVEAGESLFVLADTSSLWLSANLREHEWSTLSLAPGDSLTLTLPAYPDEVIEATVYFIGREVDPGTNSVPLVATVDNASGQLRPGMFAEVNIATSDPRDVLTVPTSSIREHDGQAFVFRQLDATTFERVDVQLGIEHNGIREVVEGLLPGESVVSEGVSYLKSELLLSGESE